MLISICLISSLFYFPISIDSAAIGTKINEEAETSATAATHRFDRLIHSVVRKTGQADIIHPTVCPPSCEHLHQAIDHHQNISLLSRLKDQCSCSCPPDRPVYLSSAGSCVDKLHECENTIKWKSTTPSEVLIPVVHLFPHSVILPHTQLDWKESKIRVSSDGEANCTISQVFYENIHHRWKNPPRKTVLFELTDLDRVPIIYFRGTEFDASFLSGAVVQIKLKCRTIQSVDKQFCVSIRISGVSGTPKFSNNEGDSIDESGWRIEIILLLAFVSFIVVTLILTLIIWNICWKIKKRKLISDFQMQFIQQYRHHQNSGKIGPPMVDIEIDEDSISPNSLVGPNRRRLYFSSEYFERELLENPPPMAEQFLNDLRRMVDVAKDRIRQRRFCPTLSCIEEEENEEPTARLQLDSSIPNDVVTSSQESSPKSEQKSIDSGRESKEDSEEDEEDNLKASTNSEPQIKNEKKVSELVKDFEKGVPRPSRLPIPLTSSIRRKSTGDRPSRLPLLSSSKTTNSIRPSPTSLIMERKNEIESRNRPPQPLPPVSMTKSYGGRSLKERKGYAVFPSDGTFNKSLPRRPKRLTPPQSSSSKIPVITG